MPSQHPAMKAAIAATPMILPLPGVFVAPPLPPRRPRATVTPRAPPPGAPPRDGCGCASGSVVVGELERRADVGRHRPALRRQVVLAGPGDGEPVAAGRGQHVGADGVVGEVAAGATDEPATRPPTGCGRVAP